MVIYKKGMIVKVSGNLNKTESMWGIDDIMKSMKGKVYEVEYTGPRAVRLRNGTNIYIFCRKDLSPLKETTPIPPVMFDPTNIDI